MKCRISKLITLLTAVVGLTVFPGCDTSPTDSDTNDTNDPNVNNATQTYSGSSILSESVSLSEGDTVWFDLTVETGAIYAVSELYFDDFDIDVVFINPEGNVIEDNGYRAQQDGTVRVGVYVDWSDSEGPFDVSITVDEYPSMSSEFDGVWLLVEEGGSAFGSSSYQTFSESKATALYGFRNDSLITYSYDEYNEEINVNVDLFATQWEADMKYGFSGNQLTFASSSAHGSYSIVLEKYSGDISNITWAYQNFEVPQELIGTWYCSYEKWHGYESEGGEVYDESEEKSYPSAGASKRIYVISAGSVTKYYQGRDWSTDSDTGSVEDYIGMISSATVNGDQFQVEECGAWTWTGEDGTVEEEAYAEIEHYTRYSGDLPPDEWGGITLPQSYTDISLDAEYSNSFSAGDSIWFRVSVQADEYYVFEVTDGDFDTYLSMVSASTNHADADDDGGYDLLSKLTFQAEEDGYYYVLLAGYSSGEHGSFTVSFTQSSGLSKTMSSPATEDKRHGRKVRKTFPDVLFRR